MTNEVTVVEVYGQNNSGDIRRFTVGDGASIKKGSILRLVDPRTASHAVGTGDVFAGIASMDKEAGDGSTSISGWENGDFGMVSSGAILAGNKVKTAGGNNYVMACTSTDMASSLAIIIGDALEAGSDEERIEVRVNN